MSDQPSIRELTERLSTLEDCKKVIAALKVATNALAFYADQEHWREDDWGVRAVITGEYGDAGKKARNAIKRIERLMRPFPSSAGSSPSAHAGTPPPVDHTGSAPDPGPPPSPSQARP